MEKIRCKNCLWENDYGDRNCVYCDEILVYPQGIDPFISQNNHLKGSGMMISGYLKSITDEVEKNAETKAESDYKDDVLVENNEVTVKKHGFEDKISKLKEINSKIPENAALSRVNESGGLFGWFNHKVNGEELNCSLGKVQDMFIASYDRERLFIKQLDGVYSVLEYLDNEYIEAILISMESATIASNQAKAAGKDAQKALKEVQATLVTQSKLIDKLTEFKTATQNDICKINEFRTVTENTTHFKDIDEMWNDINSFREFNDRLETLVEGRYNELLNVIKECEDSQSNLILRVDGHENILNDVENSLDKLKKRVYGILHFDDIDTIWEKNEKNEKTLADLKNDFEETRDKIIVNHQEFEKKVGQLVKQIETSEAKHSDDIIEVKQKSDKNAMDVSSLNTEQSEIIQKINRLEQENHELSGKISIAESMIEKNNHQYKKVVYFLIGIGFATLTIIVLNICGVL